MSFLARLLTPGRQSSRFTVLAIQPLRRSVQNPSLNESFNNDRGAPSKHSFTTEAPVSETTIDARSLVRGHSGPPSVPVPVQNPLARGPRQVSAAVMALQQNMYKLMGEGKFREAVKAFENFVNEGFREAESMGLQPGLLPLPRRPAEYQWMQYIQALSRSGRVATQQITSAILLMRQVGIAPRNAHYVALLSSLRIQGQSYRACEVIDEMIKSGLRPSSRCYEQAIITCLTNRDLNSTSMLLDNHFRSPNWQKRDARMGLLLYIKVILFCASLKSIENSLIFMRQMRDLGLEVPVHLLLDVISNAAEVDDTGAVDSLLRDLHNMRVVFKINGMDCHVPVRIDEGILLRVLNCAARTGHTFLADQAWSILKDCMILPFSHEFSSASQTQLPTPEQDASNEGDDQEAEDEDEENEEDHAHNEGLEFVKKTDQSGEHWREHFSHLFHDYKPMVESYHAFIEAQAKGGNVEKAFEALLELEENYPDCPQDLSPAQGLSMLADELAKDANTVDQAYFVLDEWHKAGKKVTVAMLDVIVAACSRMGDANRAFETFEAYPTLGITQRTESYNALMEVCASQRQVEVIMKLLQEMSKTGVKPNVDTYMQIIEGYINNGDTSGIAHALQITRREGFMPTLKVLDRAYQCADRLNDENTRSLIRTELLTAGYRFNLQFRRGGGGQGMRRRDGGFNRGGGGGGGGSPYPRGGNYQRQRQAYQGPVQTYVGSPNQNRTLNHPPNTSNMESKGGVLSDTKVAASEAKS